jgi:hypothetical protein
MRAAGWAFMGLPLSVPNTAHDQCAFRSLPYPQESFPQRQNFVFTPLLESKTERFAAKILASHARNGLIWALNSTLVSFQNT